MTVERAGGVGRSCALIDDVGGKDKRYLTFQSKCHVAGVRKAITDKLRVDSDPRRP